MNTPTTASTAAAYSSRTARKTTTAPWSTQDERFFGIVRDLFPPSYLQGATVLLAGYDPEPGPA